LPLPPFPTRRSSDLVRARPGKRGRGDDADQEAQRRQPSDDPCDLHSKSSSVRVTALSDRLAREYGLCSINLQVCSCLALNMVVRDPILFSLSLPAVRLVFTSLPKTTDPADLDPAQPGRGAPGARAQV